MIFAKASTSFSLAVGKTWTKSDTWTYAATVKRKPGKTKGRLMMFHEAKSFTAHKYRVYTGAGGACKSKTVYKRAGRSRQEEQQRVGYSVLLTHD